MIRWLVWLGALSLTPSGAGRIYSMCSLPDGTVHLHISFRNNATIRIKDAFFSFFFFTWTRFIVWSLIPHSYSCHLHSACNIYKDHFCYSFSQWFLSWYIEYKVYYATRIPYIFISFGPVYATSKKMVSFVFIVHISPCHSTKRAVYKLSKGFIFSLISQNIILVILYNAFQVYIMELLFIHTLHHLLSSCSVSENKSRLHT